MAEKGDIFIQDFPEIYKPEMVGLADVLKNYYESVKEGKADASVPSQILGQVINSLTSAVDFWQQQPSAKGKLLLIIDAEFPFGYQSGLSLIGDFYKIFESNGFWPIIARTLDVAKILLELRPSAVIFEIVGLQNSWFGKCLKEETVLEFMREIKEDHPMLVFTSAEIWAKDEKFQVEFGKDNIFPKFIDVKDVIARLKEIVDG